MYRNILLKNAVFEKVAFMQLYFYLVLQVRLLH